MRWLALLCLAFVAEIGGVLAQTATEPKAVPKLTRIASVEIDLSEARREITLPEAANDKDVARSRGLRIIAKNGDVVITRVVVTYGTGQQHFEERRISLDDGERTRVIDPRDEGRVVSSILIEFEPDSEGGKVVIEIWSLIEPPEVEGETPAGKGMIGDDPYSEMQVYFATNRRQEADRLRPSRLDKTKPRAIATFAGARGSELKLGRAIVTIPTERAPGSMPRPEIDLLITRFALRKENPARDFILDAIDVLPRSEFLASLTQRAAAGADFKGQALVFVHGYNTSFDDAIFRTAQLAHDLGFDGAPVAFSWPSRAGLLDYRYDLEEAKDSWRRLLELLELLAAQREITHVNIIAHSMGSYPTMETLEEIKQRPTASAFKLNEVLLAAPDVSRTKFESASKDLQKIVKGGITLYASSRDKALIISRKFSSDDVRAGDIPRTGPVWVPGVDTIDITTAGATLFGLNHNTFAERQPVIDDMKAAIKSNQRPPRGASFVPVPNAGKPFWKFQLPKP